VLGTGSPGRSDPPLSCCPAAPTAAEHFAPACVQEGRLRPPVARPPPARAAGVPGGLYVNQVRWQQTELVFDWLAQLRDGLERQVLLQMPCALFRLDAVVIAGGAEPVVPVRAAGHRRRALEQCFRVLVWGCATTPPAIVA